MNLQGSGDKAPPPTYQAAVQDSRYGFQLPKWKNQLEDDTAHFDGATAPLSCAEPVAHVSYGGSSMPMSRSTAPTSCGGSVAPASRGGSVAPASCGGFVAPAARGSVAPTSHGGSVAPTSRGGSVAPTSHGGSVAPISRGGSVVPTSRRGSTIPHGGSAASLGGPVPPSSRGGSIPMSRSTSIGLVSGSLTETGTIYSQQDISRGPSPYTGYNSDDDQESQLQYYNECVQAGYLPESPLDVHQDGNVRFWHVLLFSLFHMKFNRTSTSTRYLLMRKIGQLSSSFKMPGTKVSSFRPYVCLPTSSSSLDHSYSFPEHNTPIGTC